MAAMLKMKKLDIAALQKAYAGWRSALAERPPEPTVTPTRIGSSAVPSRADTDRIVAVFADVP